VKQGTEARHVADYRGLDATFRPIDVWSGQQTRNRRRAPFKASWSQTLELLKRELRQLGGKNLIVQVAMRDEHIRLDGYPRANATATHPGVVLAFDSRFGPLKYAVDTFTSWEDNIRAIALALEALRKVDRYGVTKRGEQYTGWRALPPEGATSATFTADAAAAFVSAACQNGVTPAVLLRDPESVRKAYLAAVQRLHPDRGGSVREFQQLQVAKQVLEKHHGR
jgi:hypothetical protein